MVIYDLNTDPEYCLPESPSFYRKFINVKIILSALISLFLLFFALNQSFLSKFSNNVTKLFDFAQDKQSALRHGSGQAISNKQSSSPYPASYYLSLAERLVSEAEGLSGEPLQSEEQKKGIIERVNRSIQIISEGISHYPDDSGLLAKRASIYKVIIPFVSNASILALEDIKKALSLSPNNLSYINELAEINSFQQTRNQEPGTKDQGLKTENQEPGTKDENLIEIPGEIAQRAKVVIAADGNTQHLVSNNFISNELSGIQVLARGEKEVIINNSNITSQSPIYVVPLTENKNLTFKVISKKDGEFKVGIDSPVESDIEFKWTIVK